jgi:5'-nucleotidase
MIETPTLPATAVLAANLTTVLDWEQIDTVLLDMDGTLLDLRFDNHFWQELIPQAYAVARSMPLSEAIATLTPIFEAHRGKLTWYCTDFWSQQLELDVVALKRSAQSKIAWRAGAIAFLQRTRQLNKKLILATNAHHDTLAVKHSQTGVEQYFDAVVSSHRYGQPKEHQHFWLQLEREHALNPARCLFIDDSLPVLRAAKNHGIAHVIAVAQPDSAHPPRHCDEFPAVIDLQTLLPLQPS